MVPDWSFGGCGYIWYKICHHKKPSLYSGQCTTIIIGRLYHEIRISPLISGILKDTYLTVFLQSKVRYVSDL